MAVTDDEAQFSTLLRKAISGRGISLGDLSRQLADAGTPASRAALSDWQSGRARPERPASLRALDTLEKLLDLAPGTLREALPPRAARGRTRRTPGEAPSPPQELFDLLARLDATLDDLPGRVLLPVSRREHMLLDKRGNIVALTTQFLVRAARHGVDRQVVARQYDERLLIPRSVVVSGARVGRFVRHHTAPYAAYELLLPVPLSEGDVALFEVTEQYAGTLPAYELELRVARGTQDIALRVEFPQGMEPPVTEYRMRDYETPPHLERRVPVHGRCAQVVIEDPDPGVYGLRWPSSSVAQ